MGDTTDPGWGWAWIPIVVVAALTQTARNAAQRGIARELGTAAATLARFMFGLPLAAAGIILLTQVGHTRAPAFDGTYAGWLAAAATAQVSATAFLLLAMKARQFVLAVALSKTEVLQAAVLSAVLLSELPGATGIAAVLCATAGVLLVSLPARTDTLATAPRDTAVLLTYGLLCGASFALASVCFRAASLSLGPAVAPWESGAWNLFWSQLIQSAVIGAAMAWWRPAELRGLFRRPLASMVAGSTGAVASFAWFTAYAMQNAAAVRTVGLVEVLFSYVVSRRLLGEQVSTREATGLALVCAGVVVVCVQGL